MADIRCIAAELGRADQLYIYWDAKGLATGMSAEIEIEGDGQWHPLEIELTPGRVVGYFAGPDFPSPDPALVIPKTSWCKIRFTGGGTTETRDGGFIRLIP